LLSLTFASDSGDCLALDPAACIVCQGRELQLLVRPRDSAESAFATSHHRDNFSTARASTSTTPRVRISTSPLRIVAAKRSTCSSPYTNRYLQIPADKMPDIKRWVKLITHQKPMYVYYAQPHAPAVPTRRKHPVTDTMRTARSRRLLRASPCAAGASRSGCWTSKATRSCPTCSRSAHTTCTRHSTRTSKVRAPGDR
jgi:hypothetical protein